MEFQINEMHTIVVIISYLKCSTKLEISTSIKLLHPYSYGRAKNAISDIIMNNNNDNNVSINPKRNTVMIFDATFLL